MPKLASVVLLATLITGACCAPVFAQSFDHGPFDVVLSNHAVEGGGDYAALASDRAGLDQYIVRLGSIRTESFGQWPRSEQVAFLINAYNAIVLRQVIDHYPIKRSLQPAALVRPANSVWQISGFFSERKHTVAGMQLTLDEIEHEWLRGRLQEPRIHFALVCAARSCPPLRNEAYRAETLDVQLDEQARVFLNDRERNRFANDSAELSEIFKWFKADFGGEQGLRNYLGRYLNPDLANRIKSSRYRIRYLDYDWTLNDARRP